VLSGYISYTINSCVFSELNTLYFIEGIAHDVGETQKDRKHEWNDFEEPVR
jgi:hypothetical protein